MFCFLLNNHCYCYCVLVTSVKICEWDQVETELKNVPINILKSQDKYMFLNTIKHLVSLLYEKWIFYSQHTVCWTFLASESGMFLVILAQFDYAHSKIFNCDNLSGLDHEFSHPLKVWFQVNLRLHQWLPVTPDYSVSVISPVFLKRRCTRCTNDCPSKV